MPTAFGEAGPNMSPQTAQNIARQDQCEAAQDSWFRGLDDMTLMAMMQAAILADQCEDPIIPKPIVKASLVAFMIVATKELVRRIAVADGNTE